MCTERYFLGSTNTKIALDDIDQIKRNIVFGLKTKRCLFVLYQLNET